MQAQRERTLVVGVELTGRQSALARSSRPDAELEEALEELVSLAESAGAEVVARMTQARPAPDAATLVGSGKVVEIQQRIEADAIDTVIFDHELTPTQLRNLERRLEVKILDRNQLILDIFARRARTSEGQLQVELAQLTYLLPRLSGRGTQMSRLGGGIGTRGPGETQLETDRRRIGRLSGITHGRARQHNHPRACTQDAGFLQSPYRRIVGHRLLGARALSASRPGFNKLDLAGFQGQ